MVLLERPLASILAPCFPILLNERSRFFKAVSLDSISPITYVCMYVQYRLSENVPQNMTLHENPAATLKEDKLNLEYNKIRLNLYLIECHQIQLMLQMLYNYIYL